MKEIVRTQEQLPVKVEDLAKYLIINKAVLKAKMAALKTADAVGCVAGKQAALLGVQDAAEYLLYAEARLGEMLTDRGEQVRSSRGGTSKPLPAGIDKKQSHYAQELHRHEEAIAVVVAQSRENGTVPLREHVLKAIKQPDWYQSSASVEWPTPQWLFDLLNREFSFETDVCATKKNAKCKRFFTKADNGLTKAWTGRCWMNPPYGREIIDWMTKARKSSENGATIVCLVPARPDTEWWWENAIKGEIRFIRGRIKFVGTTSAAPFPSAIVVLRKQAIPGKVIWWEVSENN